LSGDFDGKVLNRSGIIVDLPHWIFVSLKRLHLLERDPQTGIRHIRACVFALWISEMALVSGQTAPAAHSTPITSMLAPTTVVYSGAFRKALRRNPLIEYDFITASPAHVLKATGGQTSIGSSSINSQVEALSHLLRFRPIMGPTLLTI
jgi:hypothetical protein